MNVFFLIRETYSDTITFQCLTAQTTYQREHPEGCLSISDILPCGKHKH